MRHATLYPTSANMADQPDIAPPGAIDDEASARQTAEPPVQADQRANMQKRLKEQHSKQRCLAKSRTLQNQDRRVGKGIGLEKDHRRRHMEAIGTHEGSSGGGLETGEVDERDGMTGVAEGDVETMVEATPASHAGGRQAKRHGHAGNAGTGGTVGSAGPQGARARPQRLYPAPYSFQLIGPGLVDALERQGDAACLLVTEAEEAQKQSAAMVVKDTDSADVLEESRPCPQTDRHLARRFRLRMMRQISTQMTNCRNSCSGKAFHAALGSSRIYRTLYLCTYLLNPN